MSITVTVSPKPPHVSCAASGKHSLWKRANPTGYTSVVADSPPLCARVESFDDGGL